MRRARFSPVPHRPLYCSDGEPKHQTIASETSMTGGPGSAQDPGGEAKPAAAGVAPVRSDSRPAACVILVPHTGSIHPECDDALKELERRGYPVRRVGGFSAIDQGRNQLATDALFEGFQETLWIDSDIGFHPDSVERLRSHGLPIACGIYPKKGTPGLACHVGPGTPALLFGRRGGLVEITYAGAGFLHVRREVYFTMQAKLGLPVCNEGFGRPMIPFFQPLVRPLDAGHWYLAEDFAFCERARQCGYMIRADTTIRLWHIGNYRYGWEDAGTPAGAIRGLHAQPGAATGTAAVGRELATVEARAARPPVNNSDTGVSGSPCRRCSPAPTMTAQAASVLPRSGHGRPVRWRTEPERGFTVGTKSPAVLRRQLAQNPDFGPAGHRLRGRDNSSGAIPSLLTARRLIYG